MSSLQIETTVKQQGYDGEPGFSGALRGYARDFSRTLWECTPAEKSGTGCAMLTLKLPHPMAAHFA
jgi:hypothetical protein